MEEETIGMVAWNRFAKLLQGPGRHWMCSDVAMHDAPCSDLHQEEHIESSEPGGHYDQEIAGDDGLIENCNGPRPSLSTLPKLHFNDAISMTKRYFTSPFNKRS